MIVFYKQKISIFLISSRDGVMLEAVGKACRPIENCFGKLNESSKNRNQSRKMIKTFYNSV